MHRIEYTTGNNIQTEKLFLVHLLGIIVAVQENLITLDEAEHIVFTPDAMDVLEKNKVPKEIINIIHLGTELEGVLSMIPHEYENSIAEMKELTMQELDKRKFCKILESYSCKIQ